MGSEPVTPSGTQRVPAKPPAGSPKPSAGYPGAEPVGFVAAAAYGYTIGRGITYAWLVPAAATVGSKLHIEYFGERLAATVAREPLFDPQMERMRASRPRAVAVAAPSPSGRG